MTYSPSKKFTATEDDVEVLEKGEAFLLNEEDLEIGRQRIAQGEAPADVAKDLALESVSLLPAPDASKQKPKEEE